MDNPLINNAFNILGLEVSATNQEALSRSKEIKQLLHIDDVPEYDVDTKDFTPQRTSKLVDASLEKVENKDKHLVEWFFWFNFTQEKEKLFGFLKSGDYKKLISALTTLEAKSSADNFHKNKNLALIQTLLLTKKGDASALKASIKAWKGVHQDEAGYKAVMEKYKLSNELIDEETLNKFREAMVEHLDKVYGDLSKKHNDEKYVREFRKAFPQGSQTGDARPFINAAARELEQLIKIKEEAPKDGILDKAEQKQIEDVLATLTQNFSKLKKLGLYDSSEVKILRDQTSETVRILAVELNNQLKEVQWSIKLVDFSLNIVSRESIKIRLEKDRETLKEIDTNKDVWGAIEKTLKTLKKIMELKGTIPEDGVFDEEEEKEVNACLETLKTSFQKIKDLNMYETEEIKLLRDDAADAVRGLAVELVNKLYTVEHSIELLKFALELVSHEELRDKLIKDIEILEGDPEQPKQEYWGCLVVAAILAVIMFLAS